MSRKISPDDKALLEAVKSIHLETKEDFDKFVKHKLVSQSIAQPPRVSFFYGEPGKGEVSYPSWRYEINCLLSEGSYSKDQILQGVRRSCKGEAANILRRVGIGANTKDILDKFESIYGGIETPESLLKKFYACQQEKDESVTEYSARLEEICAQSIEMNAVAPGKTGEHILKRVFYQGLIRPLKQMAAFKFETERDYDLFKIEVRKLESELGDTSDTAEVKTKCQNINRADTNNKEHATELGEVKSMLRQLNSRIEVLERKQNENEHRNSDGNDDGAHQGYNTPSRSYGHRGQRHFRGYRANGVRPYRGHGRGTSSYQPQRPIAGNTFRGRGFQNFDQARPQDYGNYKCFNCSSYGHIAKHCPSLNI